MYNASQSDLYMYMYVRYLASDLQRKIIQIRTSLLLYRLAEFSDPIDRDKNLTSKSIFSGF